MDQVTPPSHRTAPAGFSLVELLVVITIMSLMLSLVAPAFSGITAGSRINQGGQMVGDLIGWARQEAAVRNREMEVRFYRFDDDTFPGWRALQVFRREEDGSYKAASKLTTLPEPIVIADDENLSPLIRSDPAVIGSATLPGRGSRTYTYAAFRFRPSGMPDAGLNRSNNFLTLTDSRAEGSPPDNYYVLQLSPITGRVEVYRP